MANPEALADTIGAMSLDGDLLKSKLESSDLVTIDTRDGDLGRVVVATKVVPFGTKVIREAPILVWEGGNWSDMILSFDSLDTSGKSGILDMYHPPLTSPTMQQLKPQASFVASKLSMDFQLVHKLMAISQTNAHEYFGIPGEKYYETSSVPYKVSSEKVALFLFGSKVAHSCSPNVTYSSRTSDGKLEYKATRPINAGDMITFPYLDDVWETPTHVRREKLLESKSFVCRCIRCTGPDYARPFSCNKCDGALLCMDGADDSPVWSCSGCGGNDNAIAGFLQSEKEIEGELDQWESKMMMDISQCAPNAFKRQITKASKKLHPHHYLTIRAMKTYVRLCASQAVHMTQLSSSGYPPKVVAQVLRKFGKPSDLRSEAASMGITLVLTLECIADGCLGHGVLGRPITEHMPVQEAVQLIFYAAQDLMECPRSTWAKDAQAVVNRYIPAMRLQYGDSDEDVAKVELAIPPPEEEQGGEMPHAKKAASGTGTCRVGKKEKTTTKQRQKTKKGGKTNKKKKGRKR